MEKLLFSPCDMAKLVSPCVLRHALNSPSGFENSTKMSLLLSFNTVTIVLHCY